MHSLYPCLNHRKNRELLIWGENHTLKNPLAATSTVPVQAAHNPTDSSAWFWKQPCVFPRGLLSSLGAWHPEAYTGKLKRVHLYVERGSGEIIFLTLVPEHATGWINRGCQLLALLSGSTHNHWGQGGVGLATFHLHRLVFHVEEFSAFHELLRFI